MTLHEIFASGHSVALARNPARRVVHVAAPPEQAGFWLVRTDALPALVVRKRVDPRDLGSRLPSKDESEAGWVPDHHHCWCPTCLETRRLSQTACD